MNENLWKFEVIMFKIIIISIGYILNDFIISYHNIIVNYENIYNFKIKNEFIFLKKTIICFVNVETDPRLWYTIWRSFDRSFLGSNGWKSSCQFDLISTFFPFIPNS